MSDPFVAEIRIFPFNFAPRGWAFCDNQLLPISQNTALFSLLGTTYGGNGTSNFALPGMEGNVPIQQGQGPSFSQYFLGQEGGSPNVTLQQNEMPIHSHQLQANTANATTASPSGAAYGRGNWTFSGSGGAVSTYTTAAPDSNLNPLAITFTGSSFPHNNLMPYLTLNFCIAMQGVFPQRP